MIDGDELSAAIESCADKIEKLGWFDRSLCLDLAFIAVCAEEGIGCAPSGNWFAPKGIDKTKPEEGF